MSYTHSRPTTQAHTAGLQNEEDMLKELKRYCTKLILDMYLPLLYPSVGDENDYVYPVRAIGIRTARRGQNQDRSDSDASKRLIGAQDISLYASPIPKIALARRNLVGSHKEHLDLSRPSTHTRDFRIRYSIRLEASSVMKSILIDNSSRFDESTHNRSSSPSSLALVRSGVSQTRTTLKFLTESFIEAEEQAGAVDIADSRHHSSADRRHSLSSPLGDRECYMYDEADEALGFVEEVGVQVQPGRASTLSLHIPDNDVPELCHDSDSGATTPMPRTPDAGDEEPLDIVEDNGGDMEDDGSWYTQAYYASKTEPSEQQPFVENDALQDEAAGTLEAYNYPAQTDTFSYCGVSDSYTPNVWIPFGFQPATPGDIFCNDLWDFSMHGFENPFATPSQSLASPVVSQSPASSAGDSDASDFWGPAGKPACDIEDKIFDGDEFAVPMVQEYHQPYAHVAEGDIDAVETAHAQPTRNYLFEFGPNAPNIFVEAPDADFATLSGIPPHEVPPVQDEAGGMRLAVVGLERDAWNSTVALVPTGDDSEEDTAWAYMIFEHGVWKSALCYREGQRIGLHLAWFIVERNGDLRRVRPRDVERAYVISGVIYNADDE